MFSKYVKLTTPQFVVKIRNFVEACEAIELEVPESEVGEKNKFKEK